MPLIHNVNVATTSGAKNVFTILETLLDAGWTVSCSSDGTNYNPSGNQISSSGSGAGGLNNDYAWFVVRDPGGRREYAFQRGTSANAWRVSFSESARFTEDSPNETIVPTADDAKPLIGSGTEASPIFSTQWLLASPSGRVHVVATDEPEGDVYWFWMIGTAAGTGATQGVLLVDACAAGSYPAADVSPVVHVSNPGTATTFRNTVMSATQWRFWTRYGLLGETWRTSTHPLMPPGGGSYVFGLTSTGGANEYSGEDDYVDAFYGYAATLSVGGYKGRTSEMIRVSSIVRAFPHTCNISSSIESRVYFEGFLLRWPTDVAPTL